MTDTLDGRWDGLMHDVEGFNAHASMDLKQTGGGEEWGGSFSFQLVGDHEPGKSQRGEIRGKLSRDGLIALETELPGAGIILFEGQVFEVKVHARKAIAGVYKVGAGSRQAVRGGTAIFWLYADKR